MYANVVTLRYKGAEHMDDAIERLRPLLEDVKQLAGFQAFHLVRTGDAESVHVAVYDTRENADAARETMLPRLREAIAEHLDGGPEVRPGDVALSAQGQEMLTH